MRDGSSSCSHADPGSAESPHTLYRPYLVEDPNSDAARDTVVFARDPRTGIQVWSGEQGYPGDGDYLDFHKKRWPGGHRYWRVTDTQLELKDKQPYYQAKAAERVRAHAVHFADLLRDALSSAMARPGQPPPILTAPFDAELFGHWWFEGAEWLEAVARELHGRPGEIALIRSIDYLDAYPATERVAMPEGSWGAGGKHQVWMNPETSWTYALLYPAERYTRAVCTGSLWRDSPRAKAIVQQLCRELLLLESSDWQFLITTGAARDYAEARFHTHHRQFSLLKSLWESFEGTGSLSQEQQRQLHEIEARDSVFPDLDPGWWAEGSHDQASQPAT
jgi:1,4-alpha-glucan branching enzyme